MIVDASVRKTRPGGNWLRSKGIFLGSIFLIFLLVTRQGALLAWPQSDSPSEYQVKAAFLYNFVKFVEWPAEAFPDPHPPFIFGIVGDDPFESELISLISEKNLGGRRFLVRRFRRNEDLRQCHILFISLSEKKYLSQILDSLKGSSILTVSDAEGFTRSGGMIGFVLEENRVRLEISPKIAGRSQLKISSKLLALARIVDEDRAGSN